MAVRGFNGTTDRLRNSVGGLTACTFGTFAATFKIDSTAASFQALFCFLSSGSAFLWLPQAYDGGGTAWQYTGATDAVWTSPNTPPENVWITGVVRKDTGTTTPRLSFYNHTTVAWLHANAGGTTANGTAPTSGFVARDTSAGEAWLGRIAVQAAWSNTVKWSADSTGDAQIEAAGLHQYLSNWVAAAPTALWPFNQSTTAVAVNDMVGTSHQSSITGTTVVTNDDPPGFSFGSPGEVSIPRYVVGRIGPGGKVTLLRRFDDAVAAAPADATVSPEAIALAATVPQVAVSVGAAPAVIDRLFALDQAAVSVGAAPAVIARSTVHPQVAVSVGVAPSVIALAFTIPQALAGESSTVSPATIALAFSVPQTAVSVGAAPALIARSFTMSQAAVSVGVAPAVMARAFALDQVAVSVGVAPAVIARAFTLPAVTADGGAVVQPPPRPPVLVTEEAIRRAQWVRRDYPQPIVDLGPVIVVGDVEAAPNTIDRSFSIPQVAVSVGVAPATIARSFTIPQATPSVPGDAIASPATIARSFVLNQVAVGVGVAPAVIARSIAIPQATPTVAVTVSAPLIARSFVMPAPAVSVGVAPAAVALAVVIPQATAGQLGDASVAVGVIALVFVFPEPGTETEFLKPWKLLGGGSPIRHPQKYGVGRTGWN